MKLRLREAKLSKSKLCTCSMDTDYILGYSFLGIFIIDTSMDIEKFKRVKSMSMCVLGLCVCMHTIVKYIF